MGRGFLEDFVFVEDTGVCVYPKAVLVPAPARISPAAAAEEK